MQDLGEVPDVYQRGGAALLRPVGELGEAMATVIPSQTVLLIDDEASIREVVEACLSDLAGWNVKAVASAQEGLTWLLSEQPDVILLDVSMPGMDAVTFLQKLRESKATRSIPVILLTVRHGYSPQKLEQIRVIDAIAKPFNPLTLADKIIQALERSS